jgi:hypothetical protein
MTVTSPFPLFFVPPPRCPLAVSTSPTPVLLIAHLHKTTLHAHLCIWAYYTTSITVPALLPPYYCHHCQLDSSLFVSFPLFVSFSLTHARAFYVSLLLPPPPSGQSNWSKLLSISGVSPNNHFPVLDLVGFHPVIVLWHIFSLCPW